MGYLQIDAHLDAGTDIGGELQTNCNGLVRASELPNLRAENMAIIGIRGTINVREWWAAARERDITVYPMNAVRERGFDAVVTEALDRVWDGVDGVYVTFDTDSIDSGYAPGTTRPEPRGFTGDEIIRLGKLIGERCLTAIDNVELCPVYDPSGVTPPRLGGPVADALRPRPRPPRRMKVLRSIGAPPSPARVAPPQRAPLRVAAVQERWHPDPDEQRARLARGVALAAAECAELVCLQELTLSPYFAVSADGPGPGAAAPEPVPGGPTATFASALARQHGLCVHASLYEQADDDGLGFNTAIVAGPDGELLARTRKLHIPVTAGYHEDRWFRGGEDADAFPLSAIGDARLGFPTCWDQWFPELARAYALRGADVLVYPTAIGSEPDHPDLDTQPLWERVITANGIANGLFMVAVNRIGDEPPLRFYGSSFISDPYGRVLVQAPRDQPAVLVADLDLDQRRDWLELFPFLRTRRPDVYGSLADVPLGVTRG